MGMYNDLATLDKVTTPQVAQQEIVPIKPPSPAPDKLPTTQRVTPPRDDARDDVMTLSLPNASTRDWRDVIENTETHSSALRLSQKEREAVEDCLRDLRRKYRIKTSMNEVVRLGLLALIADLKARGEASLVVAVKRS